MLTNQSENHNNESTSFAEIMTAAQANGEKAYMYIIQAQATTDPDERASFFQKANALIDTTIQSRKDAQRIQSIDREEEEDKIRENS